MRIRKRSQNPFPSPDLSPALPSAGPAVAAAVAPPVAVEKGAAGVKEGGAIVAAAVLIPGGDQCGGGGGKGGYYPNGLAASPIPCPPFQSPSGTAAAEGGERRVVPPKPGLRLPTQRDELLRYGHDKEVAVPKREAEDGKEIGDAPTIWDNMDALSRNGANSISSRSLGAEASEASSGPGQHTAPLMAEQVAAPRWRKEEGEFPWMKRINRAGHHARGRSLGLEEEEDGVVAERDVKPMPSMTRRRRAAAFSTKSTLAATGAGAGAGATERCDDTLVKEEGADVMTAVAAASAEGNAGVGNGKKRKSPAVLMEGSRCSRVNGRGWRCCQQTLVGYSLCEHHLGKGRLRSVSSVRSNGRARKEEDVGDLPGSKRRRNNVGMVKARSLSSLLHQPAASPTVAIAAPPELIPTPAARPATAAAPPPRATDTVLA
ncbi:hypothetical protein Taro_030449 [Colocasia esculenta]|uniref:WRC domain-containing protein n=1 Tax=Colocasia esculenta TaxID=4460 RepID=A0A843VXY6_COLES|nr:hypothetical protein [Colocasia esculenta]